MIRAALALLLLAVLVVAASAVIGQPGRAGVEWLGWRLEMTAAAAVMLLAICGLAAAVVWRALLWLAGAPARAARSREEARRAEALAALSNGFVAAASGEGLEARRWARTAAEMGDAHPALVRILAAQAAEAAGDVTAARQAYDAMLSTAGLKLAGHYGLMRLDLAQGERAAALGHAEQAYALGQGVRWAWEALLEAGLESGDWAACVALVAGALEQKIVPPLIGERARTALLAAQAHALEASGQSRLAVDPALESARLAPGFTPAVALASRLLGVEGKTPRAERLIEAAWAVVPHPALALVWRDLRGDETPRERAERLRALAALNPGHRESRLLAVEAALITGKTAAAREAAAPLLQPPPVSARLCGVMSRVCQATGDPAEAQAWTERAAEAPQEPDWSDIDAEGRAFAYTPRDWSRLAAAYAERGELIHPRLQRRDPTLAQPLAALPEPRLPAAMLEAAEEAPAPAAPEPPVQPDLLDHAAAPASRPTKLGARTRRR